MHPRLLVGAALGALLAATASAQQPLKAAQSAVDLSGVTSYITVAKRQGGGYPGGSSFPQPPTPATPPTGMTDPRYATTFGTGYDGVVRLLMKDAAGNILSGCSGSLLQGGSAILTAAHCISNGTSLTAASVDVGFLSSTGQMVTINTTNLSFMPGYTGSVVDRRDVAVLGLGTAAPSWATQYGLYTADPRGMQAIISGYGLSGDGLTGGIVNTLFNTTPNRYKGFNSWDSSYDGSSLYIGGNTVTGGILLSDFDGSRTRGTYSRIYTTAGGAQFQLGWSAQSLSTNNLLCNAWGGLSNPNGLTAAQLAVVCSTGYGLDEVAIGSGDSGGPGFIDVNGQLMIAGIASFGSQRCVPAQNPAVTVANAQCIVGTVGGVQIPGVLNGSYFGSYSGHVSLDQDDVLAYVEAAAVPEPSTYALLGTGLLAVFGFGRRRQKKS